MTKSNINICRTGGGSAPNWALRYLKELNDVTLFVCDANPLSVSFYSYADHFEIIPMARDTSFVPSMLDFCKKNNISLLIPAVDEELAVLSKHKKDFEKLGVRLVISDFDVLMTCFNKWQFSEFMTKNNFLIPHTYQDVEAIKLGTKLILKPKEGRGSTGIYLIEDQEDLNYAKKKSSNYIIQDYIEGTEYTVDTLSDMNGNFIYGCPRERVATDSGISTIGRTIKDTEVIKIIENLFNKLGIKGPANIQYIKNKDKYYFLEINPRLSGGGALTQGAQVPYIKDVVDVALGRKVPKRESKESIIMMRQWSEIFIDENP